MDFLFASLPKTNSQMTDEQLVLWQRNATFECECDNFINRRVEAVSNGQSPMESAINMAISYHGLRPRGISNDSEDSNTADAPPAAQRPRLMSVAAERRRLVEAIRPQTFPERPNFLGGLHQEAITMAIRARGLGLQRNA